MFRIYWGERHTALGFAIIGIISIAVYSSIVWVMASDSAIRNQEHHHYSLQYREKTQSEISRACVDKPTTLKSIECAVDAEKTSREASNSEKDLKAQRDMADWAFWMMIATSLMTGLTAAAVWFVFRTAQYAQRTLEQTESAKDAAWETVKETREVGEAQTRAYMVIDYVKLSNFQIGQKIVYKIKINNSGQTPAKDVRFIYRGGILSSKEPRFSLSGGGSKGGSTGVFGGAVNSLLKVTSSNPITKDQYDKVIDGRMSIYIFGVMKYKDVFGASHRTVFCRKSVPEMTNFPSGKMYLHNRGNCST